MIELFVDVYRKYDKVSKVDKGNMKWTVCGDLVKRLKTKADDGSENVDI